MRIRWREWLTIVFSLICAAVAVITVLGCEKMVPELLRASLPLIGILTFSFVLVCVIELVRENAKKYILELDDLVEIWGRILYPRDDVPLTIQGAARYRVLYQKYETWMGRTRSDTDVSLRYKAQRCADLLRSHGYVRGRLKIWQKNRASRRQ